MWGFLGYVRQARADIRQLASLGKLDEVRGGGPGLDPVIARMTLLQLSRIPSTRAAVYCYTGIVSHSAPDNYPTGAFLKKEHDLTIEGVAQSMQSNTGAAGLPVVGWYELVRELEIQHALGRL